MSVSKVWSLAAGLFFLSVLASTLQLSAAMPKSAQMIEAQGLSDTVYEQARAQGLDHRSPTEIPTVKVECALAQGGAHLISQCTIDGLEG